MLDSEVRLHVDANNFDENHGPPCICEELESRSIELNLKTFNRIYAHSKKRKRTSGCVAILLDIEKRRILLNGL